MACSIDYFCTKTHGCAAAFTCVMKCMTFRKFKASESVIMGKSLDVYLMTVCLYLRQKLDWRKLVL